MGIQKYIWATQVYYTTYNNVDEGNLKSKRGIRIKGHKKLST